MTGEPSKLVILRNWMVLVTSIPWEGPARLYGNCIGHPKFKGKESKVRTSPIIDWDGRYVITFSGTIYYLEDPLLQWVNFLGRCGYTYHPELPIPK